jgi:hypothetical protein
MMKHLHCQCHDELIWQRFALSGAVAGAKTFFIRCARHLPRQKTWMLKQARERYYQNFTEKGCNSGLLFQPFIWPLLWLCRFVQRFQELKKGTFLFNA